MRLFGSQLGEGAVEQQNRSPCTAAQAATSVNARRSAASTPVVTSWWTHETSSWWGPGCTWTTVVGAGSSFGRAGTWVHGNGEQARLGQGEGDVGVARGAEPRSGAAPRRLARLAARFRRGDLPLRGRHLLLHLAGHLRRSVFGDRHEQGVAVGVVPVGGTVAHPGPPLDIAQRHGIRPSLSGQGDAVLEQDRLEVAAPSRAGWGHADLLQCVSSVNFLLTPSTYRVILSMFTPLTPEVLMALVASRRPAPSALVLVVVLVAALAITVETTIVNVALPTLNTELGASTSGLQWIVDAYNLAFAALVLAGGGVGDRFGRRGTLIAGLILFAASSIGAALCTSTRALIGMRLVDGYRVGADLPDDAGDHHRHLPRPRQRAAAIGVWGAVTGSGWRSGRCSAARCWRPSGGAACSGARPRSALAAALGARLFVPRSTAEPDGPAGPRGSAAVGPDARRLVYTDHRGARARVGRARDAARASPCGAGGGGGLRLVGAPRRDPLHRRQLFANLRFSAASGAVTVAFFALFGFIFLITQFFQLVQGSARWRPACASCRSRCRSRSGPSLGTRLGGDLARDQGRGVRRAADARRRVRVGGRQSASTSPICRSPRRWCCSAAGSG